MNGREILKAIKQKAHYDTNKLIKDALYREAVDKIKSTVRKEVANKIYNIKECAEFVQEDFVESTKTIEVPNLLRSIVDMKTPMEIKLESGDSVLVDVTTASVLYEVLSILDTDYKAKFIDKLIKSPAELAKAVQFAIDSLEEREE